jgi:hypothetical protein
LELYLVLPISVGCIARLPFVDFLWMEKVTNMIRVNRTIPPEGKIMLIKFERSTTHGFQHHLLLVDFGITRVLVA